MSNTEQPRAANGEWTSGSNNGRNTEQAVRAAGRFPVAPHGRAGAPGSHTARGGGRFKLGGLVAALLGVTAGVASAVTAPVLRGRSGRRR